MRIGIVTWFKGPNYGTVLQAIALQWYLKKQGHEVFIINYSDELIAWKPEPVKRKITTRIKNKITRIITIKANEKFKEEIEYRDESMWRTELENCQFSKELLSVESFVNECNEYDIIVVGSDQLWNPTWYSPLYFLDYEGLETRRISYAPSTGVSVIPADIALKIEHGLKKFSAISVREDKGSELLSKISPIFPVVVVDPTLLLDERDWESIIPKEKRLVNEKYVLSIFLTDNYFHWKAAKSFAKERKMLHVVVPYMGVSYFQSKYVQADTDLVKLFNLISNAEYVITDSFHITVFSIIHKKNFYVFERFNETSTGSTNSRVRNMLQISKLENRLLRYKSSRIPDLNDIEYDASFCELEKQIKKSKQFLKDAIEND